MTTSFDSISRLTLEIYRSAREMPSSEFPNFMLGLLRSLVPFDSSRWVSVELMGKGAITHCAHLMNEPADVVLDWESLNKKDKALHAVLATPGKSINVHAKTYFEGRAFAEMRDYTQRYRHANSLIIGQYTTPPRFAEGLSIYRARDEACFDEQNRRIVDQLMPHMVEALATNRVIALAQAGTAESSPERTATAIVDADGRIQFAGSGFTHLVRLEWPDWAGAQLPTPLRKFVTSESTPGFTGSSIHVAMTRLCGLLFLKASRICPLLRLSQRELVVAQLYGQGISHKEVARRLEISPTTVRNFLQRIYSKLEISDKGELATLVARMTP